MATTTQISGMRVTALQGRAAASGAARYQTYVALSYVSALLFFTASVWGDFIQFYFNVEWWWAQRLLLASATGLALITAGLGPRDVQRFGTAVAVCVMFFLLITIALARGASLAACSIAYAPLVALIFAFVDQRAIRFLLVTTLITCFVLALYEVATEQYIYSYVYSYVTGTDVDEEVQRGGPGLFRAKGLFAGSIAASAFAILAILMGGRSVVIPVVGISLCVLTGSRSTILFSLVFLFAVLAAGNRREKVFSVTALILSGAAFLAAASTGLISPAQVERITSMLSMQQGANQERVEVQLLSLEQFFRYYSIVGQLFGNPRLTYELWEGSAENQYLSYLLDFGLVGFALFTTVFGFTLWTLRRQRFEFSKYFAFLVVLGVVSMISQSGNAILAWIYVWRHFLGMDAAQSVPYTPRHKARSGPAK